MTIQSLAARHGQWVFVGVLASCLVAAACTATSEDAEPVSAEDAIEGTPVAEEPTLDGGAVTPPDAGRADTSTTPNLRVAFIGDTSTGDDYRRVLRLIKAEKAQLVVVQGDLMYWGDSASEWLGDTDSELNPPGTLPTARIPYIASKGNHDSKWDDVAAGLKTRFTQWGIAPENGEPKARNYSVVYKGLKLVMVDQAETSPTRADYIKARLQDDTHQWKICSWHKNMRATNVGPKNNEMPWSVYENCRAYGAIVAQGHSHTYSRSKTLTNDTNQVIDTTCSDPFKLCVAPGKHFFFDSSLGGHDVRDVETEWARKPHFASAFGSSYGALFIDFHVDGDPKKARGYFKTIGGTIIDPPASSGRTSFEITSDN